MNTVTPSIYSKESLLGFAVHLAAIKGADIDTTDTHIMKKFKIMDNYYQNLIAYAEEAGWKQLATDLKVYSTSQNSISFADALAYKSIAETLIPIIHAMCAPGTVSQIPEH